MKFIYHDQIGFVELSQFMGQDLTVVQTARVSYMKDEGKTELTERDKKLIQYLAREKHTSPFEHITATFRIKVPLFVRSQIMRHRTFSYNEVSRRYTSELIEVWSPYELRTQHQKSLQCSDGTLDDQTALELYRESMENSLSIYAELIKRGVARELARCVLPQSLYTTFYMTGNLHNWTKFIKLRIDPHAQPEIQVVAKAIQEDLQQLFPVSMSHLMGDSHDK